MERLRVGTVGKPHGVEGAVYVRTDAPESLEAGSHVWLGAIEYEIEAIHKHGDRLLVRFVGIDDRTAAEGLRGSEVLAERASVQLSADEFLIADTIGLPVDIDGEAPVGTVVGVVTSSPQHRLVVEWQGTRYEVPLHPDIVTIGGDRVSVRPPVGLFDPGDAVEA